MFVRIFYFCICTSNCELLINCLNQASFGLFNICYIYTEFCLNTNDAYLFVAIKLIVVRLCYGCMHSYCYAYVSAVECAAL